MNRKNNWAKLLADKIKEYQTIPFEWGKSDCCLFACDCIKEICNIDPAENHRGTYSSQRGSLSSQKKNGYITDTLDKYFNRIDHKMKQRGDVCTHIIENGTMSMAVYFNGWWCMTEDGCKKAIIEPIYIWAVAHG